MDHEICKAGLQKNCASFVDGILIYSKTADKHLTHFKQVLEMLVGCGLKAHPYKTVICANVVEISGHNVSKLGLLPSKAKVAAVRNLKPPTNVSELRSVLGFKNRIGVTYQTTVR